MFRKSYTLEGVQNSFIVDLPVALLKMWYDFHHIVKCIHFLHVKEKCYTLQLARDQWGWFSDLHIGNSVVGWQQLSAQ